VAEFLFAQIPQTPTMPAMRLLLCLFTLAMTLVTAAAADNSPDPAIPVRRTVEYDWMSVAQWDQMQAEDVAIAEQGDCDVVFLGDSITAGWVNSPIWKNEILPLKAANFGIGGDSTQNVLWRLQHGTIGNLHPKLVVLLIGTNNLGRDQHAPAEVVRGIKAILDQVHLAWPSTKVLLYGIFPCEQPAQAPVRAKIATVNQMLLKLDDGQRVFVRDIGALFLEKDGSISPTVMGDFLHPVEEGYRRWAEVMLPTVRELLQ